MEHYFVPKPNSSPRLRNIKVHIFDKDFVFFTSSSIFSKSHIDYATKILIENCNVRGKVLDLGCGYGVVGIILKKIYGNKIEVVLSDINKRAVMLAKKNAELNKVDVEVVESDLFSNIDKKFDTIVANPAFHAGRKFVYRLLEESYTHLNNNGTLQVVARHSKGGEMIQKKIKEIFGNVTTLVKQGGVRVYCGIKNS